MSPGPLAFHGPVGVMTDTTGASFQTKWLFDKTSGRGCSTTVSFRFRVPITEGINATTPIRDRVSDRVVAGKGG